MIPESFFSSSLSIFVNFDEAVLGANKTDLILRGTLSIFFVFLIFGFFLIFLDFDLEPELDNYRLLGAAYTMMS